MLDKPHRRNAFSYKTIEKPIRDVLQTRGITSNTVQVGMPFIKATTTLDMSAIGLGNGKGFTLGLHAIEEDVRMQDIFSDSNGNSYVGYTYVKQSDGSVVNRKIYVDENTLDPTLSLLTEFAGSFKDSSPNLQPPPGITDIKIGRYKSGLLVSGEITVEIPTLAQLEMLHRTFLVPGCGMILEWGQQFAPKENSTYGERGLTSANISQYMFPWYRHDGQHGLDDILYRLARKELDLEEILERYVIPTEGQYMWMFGHVANFSIKGNADGSFTANVKIVGPSEASWAYATTNTVIPPLDRDGRLCANGANSVDTFFQNTVDGLNLKTLLEGVYNNGATPSLLPEWEGHVVMIRNGNKIDGSGEEEQTENPNVSQMGFDDSEDAYFMSWRFFVNVVLNDETYGLKAIFKNAGYTREELDKVNILRPYLDENGLSSPEPYIADPYENFVGCNERLRSIDPSTLIIVNDTAVENAKRDPERRRGDGTDDFHIPTEDSEKFKAKGDFFESAKNAANVETLSEVLENFQAQNALDEVAEVFGEESIQFRITQQNLNRAADRLTTKDRGFLSTGVWLNHKAVIQSMVSSDTILGGIINLLNRMSAATRGYWKLTVDESQPIAGTSDRTSYSVVDANFKESAEDAVSALLKNDETKLHVFNRYIRNENGTEVGSDVIDCSVDMTLPKLMFSQIATLGLVQPKDIETARIQNGESVSETEPESPSGTGPDQMLREMFAITSISRYSSDGRSPDLTVLSKEERRQYLESTCSGTSTQITANTAGRGSSLGNAQIPDPEDLEESLKEARETLNTLNQQVSECERRCVENRPNVYADSGSLNVRTPQPTPAATPDALPTNVRNVITDTPWSAGFISYAVSATGVDFPNAAAHRIYANQIRSGRARGWTALDPETTPIQRGDIIVRNRAGNNQRFTTPRWEGATHGDIVTAVGGDNIIAIGGNLSNTVKPVNYRTSVTGNNVLLTSGADAPFVVLRPPAEYANAIAESAQREFTKWSNNEWVETSPGALSTIDQYYSAGNVVYAGNGQPVSSIIQRGGLGTLGTPSTTTANQVADYVPSIQNINDPTAAAFCAGCKEKVRNRNNVRNQVEVQSQAQKVDNARAKVLRKFGQLEALFIYIEPFADLMVSKITRSANGNSSNAFGAAPGSLSITADITLPGINGLRVGQLFWIDRVPLFYRAFGAFQIMSIEHNIGLDGWTTKIHSRFNFLGRLWRSSMARILTEQSA